MTCCSFLLGFFVDVDGVPWSDESTVDEPRLTWTLVRAMLALAGGATAARAIPWEESALTLTRDGDHLTMKDVHHSGRVSMREVTISFVDLARRMHGELVAMAGPTRSEGTAREALQSIPDELPDETDRALVAIDALGRALAAERTRRSETERRSDSRTVVLRASAEVRVGTLMPFVWVGFMILFLGGTFFMRRRQMAALGQAEEKDAHARVGNVAQRMGLAIVAGDPTFNFYHTGRWKDLGQAYSRNVLSKPQRPDLEIRLAGTPGGRRVEVIYVDRVRVEDHLLEREIHRYIDMRLVVEVKAPFPEFEVLNRNPQAHLAPIPQLTHAPCSFGDPMLDQQLILKSVDPRIAPAIAEGMRVLANQWYVHVIGQNGTLTYRFIEMAGMGLGDGEKLLFGLDAMARGIEQVAARHVASAPA